MSAFVLSCENLHVTFGAIRAVNGVSLTVEPADPRQQSKPLAQVAA